jgi:hypothetical protein
MDTHNQTLKTPKQYTSNSSLRVTNERYPLSLHKTKNSVGIHAEDSSGFGVLLELQAPRTISPRVPFIPPGPRPHMSPRTPLLSGLAYFEAGRTLIFMLENPPIGYPLFPVNLHWGCFFSQGEP